MSPRCCVYRPRSRASVSVGVRRRDAEHDEKEESNNVKLWRGGIFCKLSARNGRVAINRAARQNDDALADATA